MDALLKVEDLHYYYGSIHAVKGVSFEVRPGEIVALIGANGAGKTTVLRTICGLLDPKGMHGKINFSGVEISKAPAHKITAMGIFHVLEGRHVFPQLTVEENIEAGAHTRKLSRKQVRAEIQEIYQRFPRLNERQKQLGGTLSGGEQQMLAIARALIARPKLILLDEPSLGLAPLIIQEVFDIVTEIRKQGTTILLVEQNSVAALEIADRGYVLETGSIVLDGEANMLLNNEEVRKSYLGES